MNAGIFCSRCGALKAQRRETDIPSRPIEKLTDIKDNISISFSWESDCLQQTRENGNDSILLRCSSALIVDGQSSA